MNRQHRVCEHRETGSAPVSRDMDDNVTLTHLAGYCGCSRALSPSHHHSAPLLCAVGLFASHSAVMPKQKQDKRQAKQRQELLGGKGGGKGGRVAKATEGVPVYKYLQKVGDRAYPDNRGLALMTASMPAWSYYTKGALQAWLTSENSEACADVAFGWSVLAAMMQSGCEALELFEGLPTDAEELHRTGIPQIMAKLNVNEIKDLAAQVNAQNPAGLNKQEYAKAFQKLLKPFGEKKSADQRLKSYAMLAEVGNRLKLLGYAMMEATAHTTAMKAYSKKVGNMKKQHKLIKAWSKDPQNVKKLAAAVAYQNVPRQQNIQHAPARDALAGPIEYKKESESEENSDDEEASDEDEEEESEEENEENEESDEEE
eukprot:219539-Karenia_brevis.AAC.1